jgi:hypothetical protein
MIPVLFALASWFSVMTNMQTVETMQTPAPLAHVSNSFQFEISAPLVRVAPLFGPQGERCWAGKHWDPQFIYPQPGNDVEGAVFTVQHGAHISIWVNTVFDLAGGRVQYVSLIPELLVSVIDVRMRTIAGSHTSVEVSYARTALASGANDDVTAMGTNDRDSGPHWHQAVEACLATNPGQTAAPTHR